SARGRATPVPRHGGARPRAPGDRRVRLALALVALGALAPLVASAETQPFVDGTFEERSPPLRPELSVAREHYDSATRRQALYLRFLEDFHSGMTTFPEWVSGRLTVHGATIVDVLYRAADLVATEPGGSGAFLYGIDGAPYAVG